jgi:hypothetical protein
LPFFVVAGKASEICFRPAVTNIQIMVKVQGTRRQMSIESKKNKPTPSSSLCGAFLGIGGQGI